MLKRENQTGQYFSLLRVLILFLIIALLEIFKLVNGEKLYKFLIDLALFLNLLLFSQKTIGVFAFLFFAYEGFEVVCYHYYHEGINIQIMINLDPKFALAHKSVLMLIAILVIIGLFILLSGQ